MQNHSFKVKIDDIVADSFFILFFFFFFFILCIKWL